jgi:hypothetical protein
MSGTAEDEDLYERPKGPSPHEIRARWAREGDVDSLWDVLVKTPWDRIDREEVFKLLLQALVVRGRSDPEQFAADAFARMTIFVTHLLMRCHLNLGNCIEQNGRTVRMRAQPPGDLPQVAVETLIPRTLQLQEHLATLLLSQASVTRQWALVRKNRDKGDRAGCDRSEDPRPTRGRVRRPSAPTSEGCPSAPVNGKASNRLAGLRSGPDPGVKGAHHDD